MVASNIGEVGVGIQSAKGVAAVTANARFMLTGGGIGPQREIVDLEESTSARLRLGAYVARARAGGTPAAYARPDVLGVLLYGAMGSKTVTGAADPWTHVLTLAATLPYLTWWRNVGGLLFERFHDTKVGSLTLRSVEGAAMIAETELVGLTANAKAAALAAPAISVETPFVHYDAQGQLLVEGVAVASIRSSVVTINNGAAAVPGDSLGGYAVSEGLQTITIETMQLIEDVALWNRLHYGSAAPADNAPATRNVLELAGAPAGLGLKWTRRNDAGAALAPARELEILAPRLQVKSIAGYDTGSGGDPLVATVTYQVYKPASGSGLTANLKNGVAAYAAS